MHGPIKHQVLEHALQVIELARPLVARVGRKDADLARQLRRALSSVALNVAEGFACSAGNGRLRFETARGSLDESQAAFRVAVAWRYLGSAEVEPILALADRLGARLFGLIRR